MGTPEGIELGPRFGIAGVNRLARPRACLEDPLTPEERARFEAVAGKPAAAPPPAKPGEALRALVAESDPATRATLVGVLRGWDFEAAEAPTGTQALKALAAGRVDLLLVSLKLSELDGYDVIRGLRSYLRITGTFAVALTDSADVKDSVAALNLGADAVVPKARAAAEQWAAFLKPVARRLYERAG